MPNYIYQCEDCNYEFEEFQTMKSKKLKVCPKCDKKTLVRLIGGGSGFILKGTGFYQNDYPK